MISDAELQLKRELGCDGCKFFSALKMVHVPCVVCKPSDDCHSVENWGYFYEKMDNVDHPAHYTRGSIEVADFIADQELNFDRGNAVKYIVRAGFKDPDKEIEDLEKAAWYINHEIKMIKRRNRNGKRETASNGTGGSCK